jgi:hypothetical protein
VKFLRDPAVYYRELEPNNKAEQRDSLTCIYKYLSKFDGTVEWAVGVAKEMFTASFRNLIIELIRGFPEDHVNEDGTRFWTGAKRFPQVLAFTAGDELMVDFVEAAARLIAGLFNISTSEWSREQIAAHAEGFAIPDAELSTVDDIEEVDRLRTELTALQSTLAA